VPFREVTPHKSMLKSPVGFQIRGLTRMYFDNPYFMSGVYYLKAGAELSIGPDENVQVSQQHISFELT